MMENNVKIYEDNIYEVFINFYEKPAIISLVSNDIDILTININMDYISGDKKLYKNFTNWLKEVYPKLEDIIWEWETGNDNFLLIDTKLVI